MFNSVDVFWLKWKESKIVLRCLVWDMIHSVSKETLGMKDIEWQKGVQPYGPKITFFWFSNLILYSMMKMESYACPCLLSLREKMALVPWCIRHWRDFAGLLVSEYSGSSHFAVLIYRNDYFPYLPCKPRPKTSFQKLTFFSFGVPYAE